MKVAIDFDGVCTDLSFVHKQTVNEFDYLYSPFSISISNPRTGILELVSIFSLFADLFIITSRPVEDEAHIKAWLSKNNLNVFFQAILCCGEVAKSQIMKQHGIILLIDDKSKHIISLTKNQKGILWDKQTWVDLTKEIFNFLIATTNISLKIKADLILSKVEYLTDLGSSHVFILNFADKSKLKLRVCFNDEVKQRVINFLDVATRNRYNHVSRLVTENGLVILKSFIDGKPISAFSGSERLIYISKVGSALARLHSIRIDKSISDLNFHFNETNQSLLVFSADNYNTIVTTENEVAFIDLEACNSGSRWVDFHWSENLLCENDVERKALARGYFSIFKGIKPTEEELKIAKLNYKLWLTYQLQNSKISHSYNSDKLKLIDDIFSQLWSNAQNANIQTTSI